jgi:hypothetical protein
MKTIRQIVKSGAVMLALSLAFTSCDELLGELDNLAPSPVVPTPEPKSKTDGTISFASASLTRGTKDPIINKLTKTGDGVVTYSSSAPAVATVDPNTGEVTPVGAGTTTITATVSDSEGYTYAVKSQSYDLTLQEAGYSYLKWNDGTKQVEQAFVTDNIVEVTNTTNTTWDDASKIYVVKGSVSLSGITLYANSKIILCDGATLTVTGGIKGEVYLTIYAQSEVEGMGVMNVTNTTTKAVDVGYLNIYGGKLTATATGNNSSSGIFVNHSLSIYGGDITAQGASNASGNGGIGIALQGNITIAGKSKVIAKGGSSDDTNSGGSGIYSYSGIIIISDDASVDATGGKGGKGGLGMETLNNCTAGGNAVVTITGGNGTNGNGGTGVKLLNDIFTIDGANVTIKGGNAGGTGNYNGGPACDDIEYQSGTFCFVGGAGSGSGANGKAIYNTSYLNNSSGADATFQYSTDGSAWTDFTVTAGSSDNSENVQKRYLRTK